MIMVKRVEHYEDPLIDEVRERRRQLFAASGHDLQKLFEAIKREQDLHPEKVIKRSTKSQPLAEPSKP